VVFPPPALCTDNGVMVAWAAIEKLNLGISDSIAGHDVFPRWPIGQPILEYGAELENMLRPVKKIKKKMQLDEDMMKQ
jgi:hypothetical protein